MAVPESPHGRPRIALIGPVLPFRGGIAQHTTELARALAERSELVLLSFSRLYPAAIFPGGSDRDPALVGHAEPGARYVLDTLGPRTWTRAAHEVVAAAADALVLPWWTFYFAPCFLSIARRVRVAGIPVVFVCHNVTDHEAAWWKRAAARAVLGCGAAWVVHTSGEARELASLLPGAEAVVSPHPTHDRFPPAAGVLARRAGLELLFFGFVRPYKGLDVLIEAMGMLRGEDVRLTVAGEAWKGMDATLERVRELGVEDLVEFDTRYLPDEEVAELFERADVVVLPYRSATGSGVVPVAYNYRRPVVVTAVGGLPEVVEDGRTGRIVPPEDPVALGAAIRTFLGDRGVPMRDAVAELAGTMTWGRLADAVLGACADARARPR